MQEDKLILPKWLVNKNHKINNKPDSDYMEMASPLLMTWTPQNGYLEFRKIYSTQRHTV